MSDAASASRVVRATHGLKSAEPDPRFIGEMAEHLRNLYPREGLVELYERFAVGEGVFDAQMRRVIWRAVARRFGHGVSIGSGVGTGSIVGAGAVVTKDAPEFALVAGVSARFLRWREGCVPGKGPLHAP